MGGGGNEVSGSSGEAVEGVDTSHVTREQRLLYGLKALVTEQQSWMPQSIVILQGYTPTGGETPATQLLATYAFGWRLPNRWRFDSSLRFATDSDNGNASRSAAPSTVLRMPLGERFQVMPSTSACFPRTGRAISPVISSAPESTTLHANLEVGVRVGWGLNEQSSRFFSNIGFGGRF